MRDYLFILVFNMHLDSLGIQIDAIASAELGISVSLLTGIMLENHV